MGFGDGGLFRRADGADQLHAQGLGPLAGQRTDTPGSGVEQDGFATLEFIGLTQQVLHGQPFEHDACGLFEADSIRQVHQVVLWQGMQVAVGPQRAAAICHAVTDLEARHVTAHRIDHASTFCAKARWQGRRSIEPATEVGVDEVQADGLVADTHLLRARFGRLIIHILKHFGAAVGAELDTFGHLHSPWVVLRSALSDS
ncbi:hypothetical protein D3C78_1341980 [compost metagenome]